jgi:hypothetical protein
MKNLPCLWRKERTNKQTNKQINKLLDVLTWNFSEPVLIRLISFYVFFLNLYLSLTEQFLSRVYLMLQSQFIMLDIQLMCQLSPVGTFSEQSRTCCYPTDLVLFLYWNSDNMMNVVQQLLLQSEWYVHFSLQSCLSKLNRRLHSADCASWVV